eukprot:4290737-Pleurochrysis_carterae.AAC.8
MRAGTRVHVRVDARVHVRLRAHVSVRTRVRAVVRDVARATGRSWSTRQPDGSARASSRGCELRRMSTAPGSIVQGARANEREEG